MLKIENKLKHSSHSHPWSPTPAVAILEVRLWGLITSYIYTTHHNSSKIEELHDRMQLLLVFSHTRPIEHKTNSIIKNHLKNTNTTLQKIKKDATKIRESHLHHCVDEAELEGNIVHAIFFRNQIAIKR